MVNPYKLDDGRYVDIQSTEGFMLLALREIMAEIAAGVHKMNLDTLGMVWLEAALKAGNRDIPKDGPK